MTEIIKELREVCQEECLVISHETLFEQACTFLRGEQMSNQKQQNANFNSWKKPMTNPRPATDKQLAYLQQLADSKNINIEVRKDMTSQEVSKLIEELKK